MNTVHGHSGLGTNLHPPTTVVTPLQPEQLKYFKFPTSKFVWTTQYELLLMHYLVLKYTEKNRTNLSLFPVLLCASKCPHISRSFYV